VYRDWFQQSHHKKQLQKQIKIIVHTPKTNFKDLQVFYNVSLQNNINTKRKKG